MKNKNAGGAPAADYRMEHVDAATSLTRRRGAIDRLEKASAGGADPHAVLNVGIFGEGTDSPGLSAVAFLEPRKSPVDVIQAVGRAMRTADGKEFGYVIVPLLIPPNADPEEWLMNSDLDEWRELGQILMALRAHDARIEVNLADLMFLSLPPAPVTVNTFTGMAVDGKAPQYLLHEGPPGSAERDLRDRLDDPNAKTEGRFFPIPSNHAAGGADQPNTVSTEATASTSAAEPTTIITARKLADGTKELRGGGVPRKAPTRNNQRGAVDMGKAQKRARGMIERKEGNKIPTPKTRAGKERGGNANLPDGADKQRWFAGFGGMENADAIKVNLLRKSGLRSNRVTRDLNLLRESVAEAARLLKDDDLLPVLNRHFRLDDLKQGTERADGTTVASLLMMNAAMLHQRIANGRWFRGVETLDRARSDVGVIRHIQRQWNRIVSHDFKPVIQPALEAIEAIEDTGKTAGLEQALHHLAAEAVHIAEVYADMGADHAGALFNQVMGDQSSDGAYFTRPVAASLLARLTLDAADPDADWTKVETWRRNAAVDPACGSGTLLQALLTEMKRRAREQGASDAKLDRLHKAAVEETLRGLDINPVSLQLAASRLTAGSRRIKFRKMELYHMEHGPVDDVGDKVAVGTLELLGRRDLIGGGSGKLDIPDDKTTARMVWESNDVITDIEDAIEGIKDAHIVVTNPPHTEIEKVGEKFPKAIKNKMSERVKRLQGSVLDADGGLSEFFSKRTIGPLFVSLAEKIIKRPGDVLTMIQPSIALSKPAGVGLRTVLGTRFHIIAILTCHDPNEENLSENTSINESLIIMKRRDNNDPDQPTRFVLLDRFPTSGDEVQELHNALSCCAEGDLSSGWGQITIVPAETIRTGDWTPGIWRSPALAAAVRKITENPTILTMEELGVAPRITRIGASSGHQISDKEDEQSFPVLDSGGSNSQRTICSVPDQWYKRKGGQKPAEDDRKLRNAGRLLVTAGQRADSGRLTAVADEIAYVGNSWMPVSNISTVQAKALAVFLNSTPGRLQLMSNAARTLEWPLYSPAAFKNIRVPDIRCRSVMAILSNCWERTRDMDVPEYRDGECEVRRLWDAAVADAMGWDEAEMGRLRLLLHREPHVCGRGYGSVPPDGA